MAYTALVQATAGDTILVSQSSSGIIGNDASENPSISADGRFVAFDSLANNLSNLDNNSYRDVFVKDLDNGEVMLISLAANGKAGNNHSAKPSISADGRFIAFESFATNLDPICDNGVSQIFVHDRETQQVSCVSVYKTYAGDFFQGDDDSYDSSISADGRFVAFSSKSSRLADGMDNDFADIYVHDRNNSLTIRVSDGWDGTPADSFSYGAAISANGHYIAYTSMASNLVEETIDAPLNVYLFDRRSGETSLVSVNTAGEPGNHNSEYPSLSYNGTLIVFESFADNLVNKDTNAKKDIFLRDVSQGITTRISLAIIGANADDHSYGPVISDDGKFVSYESFARNLISEPVNPVRNIYLYQLKTGETSLVSVASDATLSTHDCFSPRISADGRFVAFSSENPYFFPGDNNNASDIFRHETQIINENNPPGAFNKFAPADGATDQSLTPTLSWGSSAGADSYKYCLGSVVDLCDVKKETDVESNTSVTIDGLVPNTTYYWQAWAINDDGTTYANDGDWWSFTTYDIPGVFNKTAPADGATNQPLSPTLTWGSSNAVTYYEYCIGTTSTNCDVVPWKSNMTEMSATLDIELTANTVYYWQVRATNAAGTRQADDGTWWSFTTVDSESDQQKIFLPLILR